jgi:signal transduction histidine kinase
MAPDPRDSAPRRWIGVPPRIALGFVAALVSVVAAAVFATLALDGLRRSSDLVAHATAHHSSVEGLESALLVSDTALDAYLGTGADGHRRLHLGAAENVVSTLAEVRAHAAGDYTGGEEIARISRLVDVIRAEHAAARTLAEQGRLADARALRAEGIGADALKDARRDIDALAGEQARELAQRQGGWRRGVELSKLVFWTSLAVIVTLLLLGGRVVRDEIRAREHHEADRERALAVQRRLMAVVSHDLRNPLGNVVAGGYALSRMDLAPDAALVVRRMLGAGRRMERLIRDLLDWSRVHGGVDIPVHVCEADLYDVCRRIADELGDRQRGRVQVERRGDTRGAFDPDRMEQVVANLLGNALQYAPPESQVHVSAERDDGSLRLVVRDEGPGLPPGARDDLFKPFRRGEGHGDHGGIGLGLFIVRTLAEAQGGSVDVKSAPGAGTTFVVTVPAARRRTGAGSPQTH